MIPQPSSPSRLSSRLPARPASLDSGNISRAAHNLLQSGQSRKARALLQSHLPRLGGNPYIQSQWVQCHAADSAYAFGAYEALLELGVEIHERTYQTLLHALWKSSDYPRSKTVQQHMLARGMNFNLQDCTQLMQVYGRHKDSAAVLSVFEILLNHNVELDLEAFHALLGGIFTPEGDVSIRQALAWMDATGVPQSNKTFGILMHGCVEMSRECIDRGRADAARAWTDRAGAWYVAMHEANIAASRYEVAIICNAYYTAERYEEGAALVDRFPIPLEALTRRAELARKLRQHRQAIALCDRVLDKASGASQDARAHAWIVRLVSLRRINPSKFAEEQAQPPFGPESPHWTRLLCERVFAHVPMRDVVAVRDLLARARNDKTRQRQWHDIGAALEALDERAGRARRPAAARPAPPKKVAQATASANPFDLLRSLEPGDAPWVGGSRASTPRPRRAPGATSRAKQAPAPAKKLPERKQRAPLPLAAVAPRPSSEPAPLRFWHPTWWWSALGLPSSGT